MTITVFEAQYGLNHFDRYFDIHEHESHAREEMAKSFFTNLQRLVEDGKFKTNTPIEQLKEEYKKVHRVSDTPKYRFTLSKDLAFIWVSDDLILRWEIHSFKIDEQLEKATEKYQQQLDAIMGLKIWEATSNCKEHPEDAWHEGFRAGLKEAQRAIIDSTFLYKKKK